MLHSRSSEEAHPCSPRERSRDVLTLFFYIIILSTRSAEGMITFKYTGRGDVNIMVSLYSPITTKDFIKHGQITTVEQNDRKKRVVKTYRFKNFNPYYKTYRPEGVSYEFSQTTYTDGDMTRGISVHLTPNPSHFDKELKYINEIIEKSKIEQPPEKLYLVTTTFPTDIEYEYYEHINRYLYPESFEGHKTSTPHRRTALKKRTSAIKVNVRRMF